MIRTYLKKIVRGSHRTRCYIEHDKCAVHIWARGCERRRTTSTQARSKAQLAFAITLLCCFSIFFSCGNKETKTSLPKNVLDEEQFSDLLRDFALAEGAANMNIKNLSVHQMDSAYAFNPLKENGIRPTQYDSTVRFYSLHADLYKKVYEKALVKLSEMEAKRSVMKKDSVSK